MNSSTCPTTLLFVATLFSATSAVAQRGPALVEVTPVLEREVASNQLYVGTVNPTRRAVIGSAVDGRVVEMLADEGDRVAESQPLAQLLTETIKLELEAAKADLVVREQQLAEMENGSLPTEIQQANSRMERARVAAEFLEKERTRLTRLNQRNVTSESELEIAISAALEAAELYDEAKAAHQLAVDGPRKERIAQARAQVAIQDAMVRKLEDQIKKYTIVSRFTGYVTVKQTDVGAWVTQGDPVVEVVSLDDVDVIAKIVEAHAAFIHVGDSVRVEVPALPDRLFTGSIVAIIPQADVRSRTFPVKVRVKNEILPNGEPLLKAGMFARISLASGAKEMAILVPKDAIVLGGPQPTIWLVDPARVGSSPTGMQQSTATAVPVQLGIAEGSLIQVLGNIASGSLVVVRGNERIPISRNGEPSPVVWTGTTSDSVTNSAARAGSHGTD